MNIRKKVSVTIMAFIVGTSTMVFANNQRYTDVSADHWAYTSILNISDRGYMVGNAVGVYRPNSLVDKFDTARILAMAAGFKYTGLTQEEELFFENAYLKNQALLQEQDEKYERWTPTANREIAYLLERGILTEEDLDHFIIINNGNEQLRALSRQEAAVFIVRLIGMSDEASQGRYELLFNDDQNIAQSARHYVYFLRSKGVISGDTNNNFNPNEGVTRAALAVMLDRALNLEGINIDDVDENEADESILGTVTLLYPSLNAVQILTLDGEDLIYRLSDNAVVFVNNFYTTFNSLEEGMTVSALISNGLIYDIRATDTLTQQPSAPTQPEILPEILPDIIPTPTPPQVSLENIVYQTIHGVVKSTNIDTNTNTRSVDIEIRLLTPTGGVVSQVITYNLGQPYEITRSGEDIDFGVIENGDVVTARVWANNIYKLDVAEKHREFEATLLEKRYNESLNMPIFVVEDKDGEVYEFVVNSSTELTREGSGTVNWNNFKIGDTIDIIAVHENIIEAYAFGTRSTVDGIIQEIHMTNNKTAIVIQNNNVNSRYYVMDGLEGTQNLRVGNRVRLRLDSREIEAFSILQQ